MEAIYKLKANEINPNLMETIKKLFDKSGQAYSNKK